MTRDDIISMAREAGLGHAKGSGFGTHSGTHRFARLVAAAEREACAKVCEQQKDAWVDGSDQFGQPCPAKVKATPASCAAAIRARGQA